MSMGLCLLPLLGMLAFEAIAQSGVTLVGTSYTRPIPSVAPGQLVQLQVTGIQTLLPSGVHKAISVPLPTTLAGISVTLKQYTRRSNTPAPSEPIGQWQAPIVSLEQIPLCATRSAECVLTVVTAQVPFEISAFPIGPPFVDTVLLISENGTESQSFSVATLWDQLHVITRGEDGLFAFLPRITHVDGTLVTPQSPAVSGEFIVVYAWGLGPTLPRAKTGDVTPTPAPAVACCGGTGVSTSFSFYAVDGAGATIISNSQPVRSPAFLTPGQIGLYQVNVQLPLVLPHVVSCGQSGHNATISLSGIQSADTATLCVRE